MIPLLIKYITPLVAYGAYKKMKKKKKQKMLSSIFTAGALAAGTVYFFSPKSGAENRRDAKNKIIQAQTYIKKMEKKTGNKISDTVSNIKSKAENVGKNTFSRGSTDRSGKTITRDAREVSQD
jgi:gas vesicle protein